MLVNEIDVWGKFAAWWIGLGILSSIGFGSGMHSGIMFLFPYILKVCLTSEACRGVDFDTRMDVWYNGDPFYCRNGRDKAEAGSGPHYGQVYWKVIPAAVLWGAGTAIGEIPPYYMSRASVPTGQAKETLCELEEGLKSRNVVKRAISYMLKWMMKLIQRYGFMGVLLMASWPNAAFDLCGIVCGYMHMTFWEFFGATLLGKAVLKVSLQSLALVVLFQKEHRKALLDYLASILPQQPFCCYRFQEPIPVLLQNIVNRQIEEFEMNVRNTSIAHRADTTWWWQDIMTQLQSGRLNLKGLARFVTSIIPTSFRGIWNMLVFVMVFMFVVSAVNNLAFMGYKEQHRKAIKVHKSRIA